MADNILTIPSSGIAGNTTAQNYTLYTYNYTATQTQTYLTFQFRQDPAFWGLDDISVKNSAGTNLVANGGFETGNLSSWTLIGQQGLNAAGTVSGGTVGTAPANNHTGSYHFYDGAVNGVDGIFQSFETTVGQTYTVQFYLANDGGGAALAEVDIGEKLSAYSSYASAPSHISLATGGVVLANGNILTNVASPTYTGIADANSNVTLSIDGTSAGTVQADANGVWSISPTAPLSNANHAISATSQIGAGANSAATGITVTVDTVPPTATSTAATNGAAAGAGAPSTTYGLHFLETVTGVDAGDFALTSTGTANGTISSVSGSGQDYTVTVSGVTGTGTLNVALAAGVTITDAAGNPMSASGLTGSSAHTVDRDAPIAPTVADPSGTTLTNAASYTLTGSAESGSLVSVYADTNNNGVLDQGESVVGTLQLASGATAYSIAVPLTSNADNHFLVAATDAAGNTSTPTPAPTITEDSIPPAPAVVTGLTTATDTGTSHTDGITNVTTPIVTGTAEAGATVTLYDTDGTTVLGSAVATGGVYSITSTALAEGGHTLTVVATDTAGNPGLVSNGLSVTIDTTAPTAAPLSTVAADPTNATSLTYTETFSKAVTGVDASDFVLHDAAGNVVSGAVIGTPTTTDGTTYSVTVSGLTGNGPVHLDLIADGTIQDAAGNLVTSGARGTSVTLDYTVPTVTLASIAGDDIINAAEAQGPITLTGTAVNVEDGQVVSVAIRDAVTGTTYLTTTATVSGEAYSVTLPAGAIATLPDATYVVTADTADLAGNAAPEAMLALRIDTSTPNAPGTLSDAAVANGYVNAAHNTAAQAITGTAEAGSTVAIFDGTTQVGTTIADVATGAWSFTIGALADGSTHSYTAVATDVAGNTGSASAVLSFTVDTTASAAPSVALAHETGAGTTDHFTSDPSIVAEVAAAGDTLLYAVDGGTYSPTVPTFPGNGSADGTHTVSVAEVDPAGNVSPATSLTFNLDAIAPAAANVVLAADTGTSATDGLTNDARLTITTAETGGSITYSIDGAASVATYDPTTLAQGAHTIAVTQTDAAGNTSAAGSVSFVLDDVAPEAPGATLTHDTGLSRADHITGDPTITYTASADGDTLLFVVDGGAYSATLPAFAADGSADGSHLVSVTETDAAGNVSAATTLAFVLDTRAPSAPDVTLAHDTGASDTDHITSDASLAVATAESGGNLIYSVDGSAATSVYDPTQLGQGAHTVAVIQTDAAGNTSAAGSLSFTLDSVSPNALADAYAGTGLSAALTGNVLANDTDTSALHVDSLQFAGSAAVSIPASGTAQIAGAHGTLSIAANGSFSYQATSAGHDAFTETVTDAAGNASQTTLTFDVDHAQSAAFRFFDTKTGGHFFTTSTGEAAQVGAAPGVIQEGTPWTTPDKGTDTLDVFRFFDTKTGDHFLTTSTAERDGLIKNGGTMHYEGVAFEAYADASAPGTVALERFFNTQTGQHMYALGEEATGIAHGAAGANWVDEGKSFVVHIADHGLMA